MEFERRNATGKAGERALETFVEEGLRLIYRKVDDPDIGIDGEIEMLSAQRSSTGGLLKAQVKATKADVTGTRHRIALDERHLDYFASLTVPPILVAVSLPRKKIWWKPILNKENYRGPNGGYGITFDLVEDELTEQSVTVLRMIGERSNAMLARYLLEEVEQVLKDMDDGEQQNLVDYVVVELWAQRLADVRRMMFEAKCLLRYERRYTAEITGIETRYATVRERIAKRHRWFRENELEDVLNEWLQSETRSLS